MLKKMNKAQEQALLMLFGLTFLAPQVEGSSAREELPIATSGGTPATMRLQSVPPSTDETPVESAEKLNNSATLVSRKRGRGVFEDEQDDLEAKVKKTCDTKQSSSSSSSSETTNEANQDLSGFLPPLPAQQQRTTEMESVRNVLMDTNLDPDARVVRAYNMFVAMDRASAATKGAVGWLNDPTIGIETRAAIAGNISANDNLGVHHAQVVEAVIGWMNDESIDMDTLEDIASDILASKHIPMDRRVDLAALILDEFDCDEGIGFGSEGNIQDLVTTVEPWVRNDNIPIQTRAKLASGILEANGWGDNDSEYSTSVAETVRSWLDNAAIDTETLANLVIKILIDSNGVYRETQLEVAEAAIRLLSDTNIDLDTRAELAMYILSVGLKGEALEPAVDVMMDMLRHKDGENCCKTIEEYITEPGVLCTLSQATLIKMLNHTGINESSRSNVAEDIVEQYPSAAITMLSNTDKHINAGPWLAHYILEEDDLAAHHETVAAEAIKRLDDARFLLPERASIVSKILDRNSLAAYHAALLSPIK